jgi:GNAT superfamily N-acetyltransferase
MEYTYRTFNGDDEERIIPLWNKCMVRDIITTERFHQKVLLDENFDARGCFVALHGDTVTGFCLGIRRRYPYYDLGLEEDTGWVTVIFVDTEHRRRGIASGLLARCEAFLRTTGIKKVLISPYTPNYFIPGVDIDAYGDAYSLFERSGYKSIEKIYGMERSLLDFYPDEKMEERCSRLAKQGVRIEPFRPRYIVGLLEFLRRDYPGDLFKVALEKLRRSSESNEIFIAIKGEEVIGFSHYDGEHFGPFAIAQAYMGRGIGPCLYYRTALAMKEEGQRHLWLAWTTGHAKDFYFKLGLTTIRRHEIMQKPL